MHEVLNIFIANITLIISFMYVALKFKEYLIIRLKQIDNILWIVSLVISLLSIWIMHHPLLYEGMRIDLRGIPIYFISYLGGWKLGLIATILPSWYRFELAGPTVLQGITQGILLPFLIGSLFHRRKAFNPPLTILHIKHMLIGFVAYGIIRSLLMVWTTPATLMTTLLMIGFEAVGLLVIGLINNDVNRNLLHKKELEFHSRHDNMTNLYNLRYFKSKVKILNEQKTPFVIAMFDVDYFKNYNDTHGHPAGDAALRTIGQLLRDSMRREDVFARYGGEEFIICFTNVTSTKSFGIADRFRKLVETYPFYGEELQPNGQITISIGISTTSSDKGLDTLIEEADQALYTAKNAGRNKVHLYNLNS
ncbi:diguanylate cyclase [Cytobacillus suaedae]|nr:diguanylate cyclase [Cytobacillus suaedae]